MNQPLDSEDAPVAQTIYDGVGPKLKEFLSEYLVVGFRADTGAQVVVSDCKDLDKRLDLYPVIEAVESWGNIKLYKWTDQ